jgi:hypothetical protein
MAAVAWSGVNAVFAATTGAKTVINAIAPAGVGLVVVAFEISFDGVTASAVPALIEICQSTQATAGTSAGSAPTAVQIRGRARTGGSVPTFGHNYTAEPTVLTPVKQWYVHPTSGLTLMFPLGREIECDPSGGTVKAIAIRVNVSANVNVRAGMELEPL